MSAGSGGAEPWPVEVRLRRAEKRLEITYDDGTEARLAANYLRVESPSAEVQGHGPGQRQVVTGKDEVGILRLEPVGNYAIRIVFDDGHDTGLYSWRYLHQLAAEEGERRARHRAEVAQASQAAKQEGGCGTGGCGCQ